jgi:hypothetical protein
VGEEGCGPATLADEPSFGSPQSGSRGTRRKLLFDWGFFSLGRFRRTQLALGIISTYAPHHARLSIMKAAQVAARKGELNDLRDRGGPDAVSAWYAFVAVRTFDPTPGGV